MGFLDGFSGGDLISTGIQYGLPILGSIFGNSQASGDRNAARQSMQQAFDVLNSMGKSPDQSREIIYQHLQSQGQLTPVLEQELGNVHSSLAQYKDDPKALNAQFDAMRMYQDIVGGRKTLGQQAAELAINEAQTQQTRSDKAAILDDAMRRNVDGGLSSGTSIMASLNSIGNQGAIAANKGVQLAAQQERDRTAGIEGLNRVAGNILDSNRRTAELTKGAADRAAEFNLKNSYNIQQSQANARNRAAELNLQENQRIADYNKQLENKQLADRLAARRQSWMDNAELAKAKTNVLTGQVNTLNQAADRTAKQYADIGTGLGQLGTSIYKNYTDNQNMNRWADEVAQGDMS
jgi:hypothetical protein